MFGLLFAAVETFIDRPTQAGASLTFAARASTATRASVHQSATRRSVFTLASSDGLRQAICQSDDKRDETMRDCERLVGRKVRLTASQSCNFSEMTFPFFHRAREKGRVPVFARVTSAFSEKTPSLIYSKRNRVSGKEVRRLVTREKLRRTKFRAQIRSEFLHFSRRC